MTNKLPVIDARIGTIPDFIYDGQNGFLVEPNNPQQIPVNIIRLLSSIEKCKAFGVCRMKFIGTDIPGGKPALEYVIISRNI